MAGIYLHIPFCKSICKYCDFYRTANFSLKDSFLNALSFEIELRKNEINNETIETIYFGGGTPSILKINEIGTILNNIYKNYLISPNPEITLEMNPEDVSENFVNELNRVGVNRVSLGIQSFHDEDLKLLGRNCSREKNIKAIEVIKKTGISNISIDFIYGFQNLTENKWIENLVFIEQFDIPHISAYHLTIEKGSILYKLNENYIKILADEELSLLHYSILCEFMQKKGYIHYEISNFSKAGLFSKHNSSYWQNKAYLGFGSGAHSYNILQRSYVTNSVKNYIEEIQKGNLPIEREILSETDKYNELILTALRTFWGISSLNLKQCFSMKYVKHFYKEAQKYISTGKIILENDLYKIPTEHYLISDSIISDLFYVE